MGEGGGDDFFLSLSLSLSGLFASRRKRIWIGVGWDLTGTATLILQVSLSPQGDTTQTLERLI